MMTMKKKINYGHPKIAPNIVVNTQQQQNNNNPESEEETDDTDDTTDGPIGFSLPDLPIYLSDGEGDTTEDDFGITANANAVVGNSRAAAVVANGRNSNVATPIDNRFAANQQGYTYHPPPQQQQPQPPQQQQQQPPPPQQQQQQQY
eukprot:8530881-Ditylum_brightwellii.AAC.1